MVDRSNRSDVQPSLIFYRTSPVGRASPRFLSDLRMLPPLSFDACVEALQALAADVEELRASAAAPEIVGDSVPPEVLIRSIGSQIERLKEGKQRASERQQAMMNRMLAAPDDVFSTKDE